MTTFGFVVAGPARLDAADRAVIAVHGGGVTNAEVVDDGGVLIVVDINVVPGSSDAQVRHLRHVADRLISAGARIVRVVELPTDPSSAVADLARTATRELVSVAATRAGG